MGLFFRVSGVVLILMGFVGAGYVAGERKTTETAATSASRFVATGKPGFAFDTKLGIECDMDGVDVPKGITLDIPRCSSLVNR